MKMRLLAAALAIAVSAGAAQAQVPGGCPGGDDLVSPKKYVKMKAVFENDTDSRLNIYWINYEGEREKFGRFGPGQTANVNTFVGHPWVFVTDRGICVDVYVASKAERHHVVEEQ